MGRFRFIDYDGHCRYDRGFRPHRSIIAVGRSEAVRLGWANNRLPSSALNIPTVVPVGIAMTLQANATDLDNDLEKVEYWIGNTKIGESTVGPNYSVSWTPMQVQVYTFYAVAVDTTGARTSSTEVSVSSVNINPNVVLTAPSELQVTQPADLSVAVTDANLDAISQVEYKHGTTQIAVKTNGPTYPHSWVPPGPGNYALTAWATDARGGIGVSLTKNLTVLVPTGSATPNGTFVVPPYVYQLKVTAVGAGAGGCGVWYNQFVSGYYYCQVMNVLRPGGNGAMAQSIFAVTPGSILEAVIGNGGAAAATSGSGSYSGLPVLKFSSHGGDTYLQSGATVLLRAAGGRRVGWTADGGSWTSSRTVSGGEGGLISSCIGDRILAGADKMSADGGTIGGNDIHPTHVNATESSPVVAADPGHRGYGQGGIGERYNVVNAAATPVDVYATAGQPGYLLIEWGANLTYDF